MDCYYIYPEKLLSNNGMYLFEKEINVEKDCEAKINIFASTRYILYINEEYICEGPCRGNGKIRYYDEVTAGFRKGINRICVKVLHVSEGFASAFTEPLPYFVFNADCGNENFASDASWSCKYLSGYRFINHSNFLCPFENYDAEGGAVELKVTEYMRGHSMKCVFEPDGYYTCYGCAYPFVLEKRPIPMIYPGAETQLKPIKSGDGFVEYDAGVYMTAKVQFDIAAGSKVKILYSECYEFEDGKKVRDDSNGFLKGYYDEVKTGSEDLVYEPYWFRAFRFIRIEGDTDAVRSIKAKRCHYPLDIVSDFECSDENYNKMAEVSINTLLCCSHEIIVDCPFYEQQQYNMDSAIETAVMMRLSQDRQLVKKTINDLALSQQPSGLLCAQYPSTYTQIIPGFSFFWIFHLKNYLEETGDADFVSKYTGVMEGILNYFYREYSSIGYISSTKYWDYVDWVPAWRIGIVPTGEDEVLTIYNMYYACALKDAAFICRKIGRENLAKDYMERYESIRNTINELCYDEEAGMYRDGSETRTFSMHNIIWAVLSDVIPEDKRDALIGHVFDAEISKSSFSFNFYLFRALEKSGHYDKAFDVLAQWKTMLDNHCTTWCENPDDPRSECHAWSCAPYYEFSHNILGVKAIEDNEIIISPCPGKLTYAKGSVPTRHGNLNVRWTYENGDFNIEVSGAEGISKKVITPDGKVLVME